MMARMERWGVALLIALNLILTAAVINLGAFASKGPRYTADDGARDVDAIAVGRHGQRRAGTWRSP